MGIRGLTVLATFAAIGILLAAAAVLSRLALRVGLPPPAATVLVGVAAGGMLPHALHVALTPAVLALFLPALIFEAAWAYDVRALRGAAAAIVVLAVPGVALTALAIAGGALLASLTLPAALALGTMLAATDPVAVLALFRKLEVPVRLLTIVEGESIANDGVAVVLLQAVMPLASAAGSASAASVLGHMAYVSCAGVLVGCAAAALATPLLRAPVGPALKIAVTLAVAYGSYGAAAYLGASGILASAAAGIALPALARNEQSSIERFWDGTALVANAIVFLLTGLSLQLTRTFNEPRLLALVLAAVIVSRALLAYVLLPLRGADAKHYAWRHAVALAGLRGGLSLALALGLPADFPNRPALIDAVFAVVFFTLVVQSWALVPLIRRLDL